MVDLQQFCADGTSRYNFHRPFVKGGFLWATDARILVRVHSDEPDTVPEHGKFPNVMAVWEPGFDSAGEFVPLPNLRYELVACEECGGCGRYICPTCEHEDDCSECDGSGEVFSPCWLKIGANSFAAELIDKLKRLPGISVVIQGADGFKKPMSFRFDGAEGLISPGVEDTAIRHGDFSESIV